MVLLWQYTGNIYMKIDNIDNILWKSENDTFNIRTKKCAESTDIKKQKNFKQKKKLKQINDQKKQVPKH